MLGAMIYREQINEYLRVQHGVVISTRTIYRWLEKWPLPNPATRLEVTAWFEEVRRNKGEIHLS